LPRRLAARPLYPYLNFRKFLKFSLSYLQTTLCGAASIILILDKLPVQPSIPTCLRIGLPDHDIPGNDLHIQVSITKAPGAAYPISPRSLRNGGLGSRASKNMAPRSGAGFIPESCNRG